MRAEREFSIVFFVVNLRQFHTRRDSGFDRRGDD